MADEVEKAVAAAFHPYRETKNRAGRVHVGPVTGARSNQPEGRVLADSGMGGSSKKGSFRASSSRSLEPERLGPRGSAVGPRRFSRPEPRLWVTRFRYFDFNRIGRRIPVAARARLLIAATYNHATPGVVLLTRRKNKPGLLGRRRVNFFFVNSASRYVPWFSTSRGPALNLCPRGWLLASDPRLSANHRFRGGSRFGGFMFGPTTTGSGRGGVASFKGQPRVRSGKKRWRPIVGTISVALVSAL